MNAKRALPLTAVLVLAGCSQRAAPPAPAIPSAPAAPAEVAPPTAPAQAAAVPVPHKAEITEGDLPTGPFKHHFTIESTHDRFKNFDATDLKRMPLGDGLQLGAFFIQEPGRQTPLEAQRVAVSFSSQSKDWRFLEHHDLDLLVDGRPVHVALDHGGSVGDGYVLEHMSTQMPLAQFLQIAKAKTVEGRLFITEFKLRPDHIEALRDLASRMRSSPRAVAAQGQ